MAIPSAYEYMTRKENSLHQFNWNNRGENDTANARFDANF